MRQRKSGKILLYAVAGALSVVVVLMLAVKVALDRVPAYQNEIQVWVQRQIGYHIRFAHVAPALRWYGPQLYFDRLELRSKDDLRVLARARGGLIGLDIWEFLRGGRLPAGKVRLDAPDIVITRMGPASFAIAAEIEIKGGGAPAFTPVLDDLPTGEILIRGGRLTVQNWNAALPTLVLDGVNFDIRREASLITGSLGARLPAVLGGTLNVTGTARGAGDLGSLAWNAQLRAHGINFPGWRTLLPEFLDDLDAGTGDFAMTAQGRGGELARAELNFAANNVVTGRGDGFRAQFARVSGDITFTHAGDRWELQGRDVRAQRDGRNDPVSQFDIAWRASDAGLTGLSAQATYLRLENLLPLAGLLPQTDLRDRLLAIAPTGEWSDAHVDLQRSGVADPWRLQVRAAFHDVGFAPMGRAPGLRGLSGSIAGDQNGGHVTIDTRDASVAWPRQWPQPVDVEAVNGTIYWKRTPASLLIATPALALHNHDAAVQLQAALEFPTGGDSPLLTLVSRVENGNVANAHLYLPREQIAPKALDWLDRALVSGNLPRADAILRGRLSHFPFRDGSGLFLVRLNLVDFTLDYRADWPKIENIAANAEFRNEGLTVQLLHGTTNGVVVEGVAAKFPDFKNGELTVHAETNGDAAAALAFLRATPLDAAAGRAFSGVNAAGPLRSQIELFLPFKNFEQRRVVVHGQMDGVTLERPGLPLTATDLSGDFEVDGGQVARADLRGRLLGGGFHVQARGARTRPLTRTQLDFRGSFGGDAARAALGLPAGAVLRGSADWHGVLKMAPDPARERSFRVHSSLAGLEIRLPEPLLKRPGTALPSWVEFEWPSGGGTLVSYALGPVAHGVMALESGDGGARVKSLDMAFGDAGSAASDGSQIVNLGGTIERLDLGGWLRLFPPDRTAKPLTSYLHEAKLQVNELDYLGLAFREVEFDLKASADRWDLRADGPNVVGKISFPVDGQSPDPWELDFERLRMDDESAAADGEADAPPTPGPERANPRSVPALHFSANDLVWGDKHLGSVHASLSRHDDGVSLDRLAITAATFNVTAQGHWRGPDTGLGHIDGVLNSSDVQTTMKQLGYADVISARAGRLDFDLNWVGAPSSASLRETIGHVQVTLDKGQLFGIKPGAGRVLGLASIAALPRRLALDFSDLTDKGLAFDTIRGGFDLRGGNAYTDDVLVKGPAAEIGLIGRIGLKAKDYDQTAVVTGSISNAFPIAGAAGAFAAGPVVGAAVLLFTQVFKQPLKGLARGYYRITGSWDNPNVERINSAGAAAATAEVPK